MVGTGTAAYNRVMLVCQGKSVTEHYHSVFFTLSLTHIAVLEEVPFSETTQ